MDLNYSRYRIYLNGYEVPASNITITSSLDRPSVASFSLHPTDSAFTIPYRVAVHITLESDIYRVNDTTSGIDWDNDFIERFPPEKIGNMPEVLIFEGEITQKAFLKSRSQNAIQFQAMDFRNMLDTPLKQFVDFSQAMLQVQSVRMENKKVITKGFGDYRTWLKGRMDAAKGDFLLLLKSFISNTANQFFENYVVSRKIKNRMFGKVGNAVKEKLKDDVTSELILHELQSSPVQLTMNDLIHSIYSSGLGFKFLHFITNTAPPPFGYSDDNYPILKQFLVIPNLVGIIPPKCNVFFPQLIGSISGQEQISYTRAMLRQNVFNYETMASTSKRNEATKVYMAPTELGTKINSYLSANANKTLLDAVQKVMTDEEEIVGIFPLVLRIPSVTKDADLAYVVDYAYKANKYANNNITLSNCPLNPFPVVGFPALVFTKSGTTGIGTLAEATHTLNDKSQYSNFIISNFIPTSEVGSPPSLLVDYDINSIDDVYNYYLNQYSIKNKDGEATTQGAAINKVITFYNEIIRESESPFFASMSYARRPLVNICEAQEFLFAGYTKTYKVQMGDTLSRISQSELGSADLWTNIWENPKNADAYNRADGDEHNLKAGEVLYIPMSGGISPVSEEANDIVKAYISECKQFSGSLF